jgi:hypothetical protein
MTIPNKLAKAIGPLGQQQIWGSAVLTSSGLTAQVAYPGGVQGGVAPFADVYSVSISSSDTVVQTVTLSDGVNSVTWQVGATPVADEAIVPYRFAGGGPGLVASAGAVSGGAAIDVTVRGIVSRT